MEEGIHKKEKEIRSQMRTEKDELERAKTNLNAKAARPQGVEQDPLNPQHMGLGDFPDAPLDGRGVTPAGRRGFDEVSTPERGDGQPLGEQQPAIRPDGSEVIAEHAQFVKTGELL